MVPDSRASRGPPGLAGRPPVPVTVPKSMYGHLYGASAATELAAALLSFETGLVPPTHGLTALDSACDLDLVTRTRERPVRRAVISARAREGMSVALTVARDPIPVNSN